MLIRCLMGVAPTQTTLLDIVGALAALNALSEAYLDSPESKESTWSGMKAAASDHAGVVYVLVHTMIAAIPLTSLLCVTRSAEPRCVRLTVHAVRCVCVFSRAGVCRAGVSVPCGCVSAVRVTACSVPAARTGRCARRS